MSAVLKRFGVTLNTGRTGLCENLLDKMMGAPGLAFETVTQMPNWRLCFEKVLGTMPLDRISRTLC